MVRVWCTKIYNHLNIIEAKKIPLLSRREKRYENRFRGKAGSPAYYLSSKGSLDLNANDINFRRA